MELVAGTLGVAEITARTSSKIWKLCEQWRNAPRDIFNLRDEVDRAHGLYANVEVHMGLPIGGRNDGNSSRSEDDGTTSRELETLLLSGQSLVRRIQGFIDQLLDGPGGAPSGGEHVLKRRRVVWLRHQSTIRHLRRGLRQNVEQLSVQLVFINLVVTAGIPTRVHELLMNPIEVIGAIPGEVEAMEKGGGAYVEEMASDDGERDEFEDARSVISDDLGLETKELPIHSTHSDRATDENPDKQLSHGVQKLLSKVTNQAPQEALHTGGKPSVISGQASVDPWTNFIAGATTSAVNLARGCDPLCGCSCHNRGSRYSWATTGLQNILGSFQMSVIGSWPFIGIKHSDPSCVNVRSSKMVHVQYRLPDWVMGSTIALFVGNRHNGPEFLLRVRTRVGGSRAMYDLYSTISYGDVDGTKRALVSGRASIHDALHLERGCSPLHYAITFVNMPMIRFLLTVGADLYMQDDIGIEPIATAFQIFASRITGAQGLPDVIPFDEYVEDEGFHDLQRAMLGLLPLPLRDALRLPRFKAQVNLASRSGLAPIHLACTGDEVRLLAAAAADLDAAVPPNQATALMRASHICRVDVIEALLACGADPDLATRSGNTPLNGCAYCMWEERHNVLPALRALLRHRDAGGRGPDLERRNTDGHTVLMNAANYQTAEFVWVLLAEGPNGMGLDNLNHGPLVFALDDEDGVDTSVKVGILLCYGVETKAVDKDDGDNVLHFAARSASAKVLKMLEQWGLDGVDPELRDFKGNRPMELLRKREDFSEELEAAMDALLASASADERGEPVGDKVARVRVLLDESDEFRQIREKWPLAVQGFE